MSQLSSASLPAGASGGGAAGAARAARATLVAAVLGNFVVTLDALIVNVALPSISAELGGGITGLQWVVDGYTLMFAALLLSSGAVSDRFGARRAFGIGIVGFVLASVACGVAPNLGFLVAARLAQGSAAAVVVPATMALLRHAFPDPGRRARAVAYWGLGGAVAASSGPVLGGLLSSASWRLIFLVNVPVGIMMVILLARTNPSPKHRVPFDWAGQVTAVLAIGGLVYAAIEAGAVGLTDPRVVAAFAVGVLALGVFILVQARSAHPMVPLELFRSRDFSSTVVIGFAYNVGFYGLPFVMSLYLQQVRGLSALATGAVFVPMMVIGMILTPMTPRIVEKVGARRLISVGLVLLTAGLVSVAYAPAGTPAWGLALVMIMVGLAGPFVMPPTTAVLLSSVPAHRGGTASGVFNTSRQVGGALAVAVFGTLLAHSAAFTTGMRTSLLVAAVVGLIAIGAGLALRGDRGRS